MATRYTAKDGAGGKANLGYQEGESVDALNIPSCTIEDVDRSVFNLFEKELDFTVESNKKPAKVPVIFATGERFAILARKKPLRDANDVLILPLISIMRTQIENTPGIGQNIPLLVKKRLAPEDANFQAYKNKQGIINSDQLAKLPGRDAEEGESEFGKPLISGEVSAGQPSNPLIKEDFNNNIFEIFEIPPVKHYTANYEITFWCQYTQQMNQMISIFMGGYTNNAIPSFRLDTNKGYYFSGIVESSFSPDVNFDDFSDNERLVKCTLTMKVFAYLVAPRSIGQPSPVKRFVSAPSISFGIYEGFNIERSPSENTNVASGKVDDYVLQDIEHELLSNPKQQIGGETDQQIESKLDSLGSTTLNNNIGSIGQLKKITSVDPTTGKKKIVELRITEEVKKSGETVLRLNGMLDKLDDLFRNKS